MWSLAPRSIGLDARVGPHLGSKLLTSNQWIMD